MLSWFKHKCDFVYQGLRNRNNTDYFVYICSCGKYKIKDANSKEIDDGDIHWFNLAETIVETKLPEDVAFVSLRRNDKHIKVLRIKTEIEKFEDMDLAKYTLATGENFYSKGYAHLVNKVNGVGELQRYHMKPVWCVQIYGGIEKFIHTYGPVIYNRQGSKYLECGEVVLI